MFINRLKVDKSGDEDFISVSVERIKKLHKQDF